MRSFYFIFILFFAVTVKAQVFNSIVDAAGNGDYLTITEAVNAVHDNQSTPTLIFVKAGTYNEKVVVPATKIFVSIIGENVETVSITWADYAGSVTGLSSSETATLQVDGTDFYMENITVKNTAGNVGQALAIRTVGDRGVYKNCRFTGFQDTYYAHKARQFNYRCYVEGATDFVYGDATAVFDQCEIKCLKGGQYISAPADTKLVTTFTSGNIFYHGIAFRECDITAEEGVAANSYYLGRPWQPKASVVYIQCVIGNHIKPIGWSTWNDNNHTSSYFAEYQNVDINGNPIDVTQRADWSYQITDPWFNNFYKYSFFFRKNFVEWDPVTPTRTLETPKNIRIEGSSLMWDAVSGAIGYIVYNNEAFVSVVTLNEIANAGYAIENIQVKSVRDNGALSTLEDDHLLTSNQNLLQSNKVIELQIRNNQLVSNEEIAVTIFDLNGQKAMDCGYQLQHDISGLPEGLFIISVIDRDGNRTVIKHNHFLK